VVQYGVYPGGICHNEAMTPLSLLLGSHNEAMTPLSMLLGPHNEAMTPLYPPGHHEAMTLRCDDSSSLLLLEVSTTVHRLLLSAPARGGNDGAQTPPSCSCYMRQRRWTDCWALLLL